MATCTVCELHAESTFKVEGMDCRDEVALIERRFKSLRGLEDFSADLIGQRLHVKYDAAKLTTSTIAAAVSDTGLRAWLEHQSPEQAARAASPWRFPLLSVAGALLGAGQLSAWFGAPATISVPLLAASLAASVPLTWPKARHALRLRALDINVLMLVAAAGAVALGDWPEAAAVAFMFAIAQALEVRTLERARRAVRALLDLAPATVVLRDDPQANSVLAELVPVGAVIVVRPGESIALDGDVVTGHSAVNQAPVTGESMPADKAPGDEVFAGTINGHGALEVRVTRQRSDTTLARIIRRVEQAQAQRAPSQTLVERFAAVYTPAVLALALLLAIAPPLLAAGEWRLWFERSLVLLVVSCPCALVISTPVSIVAALAAAARRGVLIKGGVHLERASRVRAVAFDKTGTLTRGMPNVISIQTFAGESEENVLTLAAAVEQRSEHPIGAAIVRHAASAGIRPKPATDVVAHAGRGASGLVSGWHVLVGNHRLFEERQLCSAAVDAALDRIATAGLTPVIVARDQAAIGVIALGDAPRSEGVAAVDALRRQGMANLVILTGDSAATARAVGAALGLADVRSELMPEDKVAAVGALRDRYGTVAMVGDGINDAPALASADVGIAMGAAGSDAAIETADIALMSDDLRQVPYVLRLSQRTVRNIRVNLTIALALKLAFVVAAVTGHATLWMAVLADTGASVIVVANALRLLRAD